MAAAIALNGHQLDGKAITVRESLPPKQKGKSRGRLWCEVPNFRCSCIAARIPPPSGDTSSSAAPAPVVPASLASKSTTSLVPRTVGQRQRPGIGFPKAALKKPAAAIAFVAASSDSAEGGSGGGAKTNDDFRKMFTK